MTKQRKVRGSILAARISNFPLLKPFLLIIIGLYALLTVFMMYEIRTSGKYDHTKYQRNTQSLETKEIAAFNELGLSKPITEKKDYTGANECYFSAAGFGVSTSSDWCFTAYTVVLNSVPSVDDFDKLLSEHGWKVIDTFALEGYRKALVTPSRLSNPPTIIYYRSEPGIKFRVEVTKCPRTTTQCTVAETVFSNQPTLTELYEVRVKATVERDAIQKWQD